MKVAYNNCFGGFRLSSKALAEFAKKKGVELTWYRQVGHSFRGGETYKRLADTPDGDSIFSIPLIVDAGDEIKELPSGSCYSPSFDAAESRCDSDLIAVIEYLGVTANGARADLQVVEVPDGAAFEIDRRDGKEMVVKPNREW